MKLKLFPLLFLVFFSCVSKEFRFAEDVPLNEFCINDTMIYDSIREAVLKPGMSRDEVIKIYGEDLDVAVSLEATPFNVAFLYARDEVIAVSVYKNPDNADNSNLKTWRGIGISDTRADIEAAYRTDFDYPFQSENSIMIFFDTEINSIITYPAEKYTEPYEPHIYSLWFDTNQSGEVRGIMIVDFIRYFTPVIE